MGTFPPTTHEKARRINVDGRCHGAFAEIGAGQEVARWFFHVGGAAGTVAKTISAYDMAVSDEIYGPTDRYVSRTRLEAMLEREYALLLERLGPSRGAETAFFVFADTMATRSFSRHEEGHGWLGVRFQPEPGAEPSRIVIHVRLLDTENAREQEAVGIVGVNLLHGALYLRDDPAALVVSLLDDLDRNRLEVDLVDVSGPCFADVDDRLLSLDLVEKGLSDAAMFTAAGQTVLPGDVLHKQPALLLRGSHRPVTITTLDMLDATLAAERSAGSGPDPVVIFEMSLQNLLSGDRVDPADFLARADILRALGHDVMISRHAHHHALVGYLRRQTRSRLVFALGTPNLRELLDERYYGELEGGILEAMGLLFRGDVKLLVYPFRRPGGDDVETADNVEVASSVRPLVRYLLESGRIAGLPDVPREKLRVSSGEALARLQAGDPRWEELVPEPVVGIIRDQRLFGYRPDRATKEG